jgi:small subunit ribosomal protein S13
MARILGVDLPRNKAMKIAIRSSIRCWAKDWYRRIEKAGIDGEKNSNDLTEEETNEIRKSLMTILLKVILEEKLV